MRSSYARRNPGWPRGARFSPHPEERCHSRPKDGVASLAYAARLEEPAPDLIGGRGHRSGLMVRDARWKKRAPHHEGDRSSRVTRRHVRESLAAAAMKF